MSQDEVVTFSGSAGGVASSDADPSHRRTFELYLAKEDFKFSAAHFVAHDVSSCSYIVPASALNLE